MKKLFLTLLGLILISSLTYSQVVCPPTIPSFTFTFSKPVTTDQKVGGVSVCDQDVGQTAVLSIPVGNTLNLWKIDTNGNIMVNDATAVNNSLLTTFVITIKVTDNGVPPLSMTATVSLNDVNNPPVINSQTFSIIENSINGVVVGTVLATDPNNNQTKTYSIVSGNTGGTFVIGSTTGIISVFNSPTLNFEVNPTFALVVKVTDNGTGNLSSQSTMTINLTDVNESPIINNQTLSVNENSLNGTVVGTILSTDPDIGQSKTFSIVSGNTNGTFSINSATGALLITNTTSLNYEVTTSFTLVVKVTDNATIPLSGQSNIQVNILDVNESPVMIDQTFQ